MPWTRDPVFFLLNIPFMASLNLMRVEFPKREFNWAEDRGNVGLKNQVLSLALCKIEERAVEGELKIYEVKNLPSRSARTIDIRRKMIIFFKVVISWVPTKSNNRVTGSQFPKNSKSCWIFTSCKNAISSSFIFCRYFLNKGLSLKKILFNCNLKILKIQLFLFKIPFCVCIKLVLP